MTIEALLPDCPWSNFLPPTMQFCEKNLCSYITTPANTWSNLGYIFIGLYLLLKTRDREVPQYLRLIAISAILTGVASFLYHASFTFFFQFFDLSAMYLFSSLLIALNWKRLKTANDKKVILLFVILVFSSMALLFIFKTIGIFIFALHLLVALALEIRIFLKQENNAKDFKFIYYKNFIFTILCFSLALGIWILDFKRIICDPDNHILQGHAIWHILTAFCYLFLFRFYSGIKNA